MTGKRLTRKRLLWLEESLKTRPRSSEWLLSKGLDPMAALKALEKAGVKVECGRSASMDPMTHSLGKLFWWVDCNRATQKKEMRKLRLTELSFQD